MSLGKSLEDYLEAVLILQKSGKNIRSVHLANYMKFSKASISHAVKELRKKGYLIIDSNGYLQLTDNGIEIANKIYERHCFFMERLIEAGVDPKQAELDACQMEHVISDESFHKLKKSILKNCKEVED